MEPARLPILLAVAGLLAGCATQPAGVQPHDPAYSHVHEGLLGTLWVQTAGEYDAISTQAYRQASDRLKEALVDPSWTAALEQKGTDYGSLPPAVIVDVDETVLDNSPFQARLVADGSAFTSANWAEWCEEASAEALPGALDFAQLAEALNVVVFYVTNRDVEVEEVTRANLESEGFPIDDARDVLLMKGENGWTSDKTTRRTEVAKTHRILLLLGDDLNDFASGARADDPADRRDLVSEHRAMWGSKWIVLPNPLYGSWEASLFSREYGLPDAEKIERKLDHLEPLR